MIKKHSLSYGGMNQDIAKSKKQSDTYYSALNMKIMSTGEESTFALSNSSGNELLFDLPSITLDTAKSRISYSSQDSDGTTSKILKYRKTGGSHELEDVYAQSSATPSSGTQKLIGSVNTKSGAVLVSSDFNGWDCFWELTGVLEGDIKLDLLYLNDLGFTKSDPLNLVYNFENNIIEKIYFVDGKRQLSSFNMRQSVENGDLQNLIDLKGEMLNSVSKYNFSSPDIKSVIEGGNHSSGMVQYAYNLYILNGAQTTISPLSELIPIGKGIGKGGGRLNEALGKAVSLEIKNIDQNFTHIRVYSIKYTSLNESPSISLIEDREINSSGNLFIYDDGLAKDTLSLEQFLFLGSAPIVPKHLEAKDSRLFLLNVKEKYFKVDIDARCYGHDNTGDAVIWENLKVQNGANEPFLSNIEGSSLTVDTTTYSVPEKHDSINKNYDIYSYLKDGVSYGAEGKYFMLEVVQKLDMPESSKVLKDEEIYRFGIEFYNSRGTVSEPLWLCDLKAPKGNLKGHLNTVKLTLKQEFFTWINTTSFEDLDLKPVGFRVLRASRNESDKTIAAQGLINPMVVTNRGTNDASTRRVTANGKVPRSDYPNSENFPFTEPLYTEFQTKKMPSMIRTFQEQEFEGERLERGKRAMEICEDGLSLGWSSLAYTSWRNGSIQLTPSFGSFHVPSTKVLRSYPQTSVEIFHSTGEGTAGGGFWQMNKMIQMDSPESMFTYVTTDASQKLKVVGFAKTKQLKNWAGEYSPNKFDYSEQHIFHDAFTARHISDDNIDKLNGGTPSNVSDFSLLGPSNAYKRIQSLQILRDFSDQDGFTYAPVSLGGNLQIWQILIQGTAAATAGQITVEYDGNSYPTAPIPQGAALSYIKGSLVNSLNNMEGISWTEGFGGFVYGQANSPGPKPGMLITVAGMSGITASVSTIAIGDYESPDQPRNVFDIYGSPEKNDLGANFRDYNNDPAFSYGNTCTTMYMDRAEGGKGGINDDNGQHVKGLNAHHCPSITIIEGDDSIATPIDQRKSIEEMWQQSMGNGFEGDGVLVAELVKNSGFAYVGSIYGGNSYEDKSNSDYIPIGQYAPIEVNLNSGDTEEGTSSQRGVDTGIQTLQINNPGDTFVQNFKYLRLSPAGLPKEALNYTDIVEIVYIRVETTIDLNNRSDLSISQWNSSRYTEEEDAYEQYNDYNTVYSQDSTLVKRNDLGFKFKPLKEFDTKIIASKQKIGGEFIDSWTDFLENETMELDGKYGSINATINFKDDIYVWQDNGMSKINVNPRVQIPGSDGAGLELGVGAVLNDYTYISTEYGAINDSSIITSNSHIYFFDANNSSINRYGSDGMQNVTDAAGMHTYFQNNIDSKEMVIANPLLGSGITGVYDNINRDVYFTFLQKDFDDPRKQYNQGAGSEERSADTGNNFTICYNETLGKFTSFFSFTPPNYLYIGKKMLTTNAEGSSIWSHNLFSPKGDFYGKLYPSSIDLSVNPGGTGNKTFNNLEYRMESKDYKGDDYPNHTFSQVLIKNDYQTSLSTPLVIKKNIKRRNRTWNLNLPREAYSRERIRSPWSRIRLLTNNSENLNMIAHDLIVSYTEY